MVSNQIIKLFGALVVLLGIAYLSGAFDKAPTTIDVPQVNINTDAVDHIEVITPLHTVVTEKMPDGWLMTEPIEWRADTTAISRFLGQLKDLKFKTVVSLSPDRYDRYGVDSTAFTIKVDDGHGVHEFIMSPKGPDYMTVYMRIAGDERVFSATPRLSIPLSVTLWRDKRMFSVPPLAVLSATISSPEESIELKRDMSTSAWTIEEGGKTSPADSLVATRWLGRFRLLSTDGFLDEVPEGKSPTHYVEFELVDKTKLRLNAIEEESRFVLTMDPPDGTVYYLNSSRAKPLFPTAESLRRKE